MSALTDTNVDIGADSDTGDTGAEEHTAAGIDGVSAAAAAVLPSADRAEEAAACAVAVAGDSAAGRVTPWVHKVQYYETDQMQVVHHSNFVRWFEECRVHTLEEIGYGYDRLEAAGIISPVLTIEAKIKISVRFGETVKIRAAVEKFDGVRLTIRYEVLRDGDDALCCTGATSHCFLDAEGRLISLKRKFPEVYEALGRLPKTFE